VFIKLKLFKHPLVIEMGHSGVEIEISDLGRKKSTEVKALVDSGASLTVLPEKLVDELGIEPKIFDVDPATGTLKERPLLLY
jgi:predicted aspartyl protease